MKLLFLIPFLFLSSNIKAQIIAPDQLMQSSPVLEWETIQNDFVKLIYPTRTENDSVYVANLVEYYSQLVGLTYGIKEPDSFPLIIRPEMAQPNGFVTLAPRRSEWYSSAMFGTFLSSAEWYQILAIHEYRHIIQYDYFKEDSTVKVLRYLFGDLGQQLAMFLGLQPWYFEGDAVWAETKYTDTGRGRSPLFLTRLKALVLSDKIPTYEQLVNGSYNTLLPNHYVFGYVLISNATKKFGENFWQKVIEDVSHFPHPYRLYSSFRKISGQDFFKFYDETMKDLKETWSKDADPSIAKTDYREHYYPFKTADALYYLYYNLDGYWSLTKKNQEQEEKIIELPFTKDINEISLSNGKLIYTQFLPNRRYAFKGSSDLILVDLESRERTKLTLGERLFNPRFNPHSSRILAATFNEKMEWNLVEFDLEGKEKRTLHLPGYYLLEAMPLDQDHVVAIVSNQTGHKSIELIHLNKGIMSTLLPASRNNIHNLYVDEKENILFEAQYKGKIEIFKFDEKNSLSRCTETKIAAYTPSASNGMLYYSEQDSYGSHINSAPLKNCVAINKSELVNFNYLGKNPSDDYNNFPPRTFAEQKSLRNYKKEKYNKEEYGDIDKRLFIPHSWSFIGSRGFELSASSDNYLRTLGIQAKIGRDNEEGGNYTAINFDFKKYYPIFSFHGELRDRKVELFDSDDNLEWKERLAGVSMTLPYIYKRNLYNFNNALRFSADYLDTGKYQLNEKHTNGNDQFFYLTSVEFSSGISKDLAYRSIISPRAIGYYLKYENAHNLESSEYSSYRFFHQLQAQTPGFFKHNAFKFTFDQDKQKATNNSYRFLPIQLNPTGYTFSRGYQYESVPEYSKFTGNYLFPVAYPDLNLWGVYYLRRAFMNAFFDSTLIDSGAKEFTYNSTGLELELESKFFRILPINFGFRYIYKLSDSQSVGELYVATALTY